MRKRTQGNSEQARRTGRQPPVRLCRLPRVSVRAREVSPSRRRLDPARTAATRHHTHTPGADDKNTVAFFFQTKTSTVVVVPTPAKSPPLPRPHPTQRKRKHGGHELCPRGSNARFPPLRRCRHRHLLFPRLRQQPPRCEALQGRHHQMLQRVAERVPAGCPGAGAGQAPNRPRVRRGKSLRIPPWQQEAQFCFAVAACVD